MFITALLLVLHLASATRVCKSVNVRNSVSSLRQLEGCAVVEGYVQVVLIERANESDFLAWSFPELREVTEYLLFYRVPGLRRLGQLFPNLGRVGGAKLFLDYGLVVHEMFGLRELGLNGLQEVTRGSVIITKNPSLCYAHTVDWDRIAAWDPGKNYVAKNKPRHDCPSCPVICPLGLCWSRDNCQIQEQPSDCHPLCVGGCSAPGPRACHSCRALLTADGECTRTCPDGTYQYLNRRCVTEIECLSTDVTSRTSRGLRSSGPLKHLVFNGSCVDSCPVGYELAAEGGSCEPCRGGRCLKHCPGVSIENIGDAQALRGCTHIDGSLEISIRAGKSKTVMEELEENLGSIEEIGSYLKVVRSFPIVSLKFLRNLTTIWGDMRGQSDAGFGDNYSLLVLDNTNLQELWDWEQKPHFKIVTGKVFFHYNPKLCLQHIHKLLSVSQYEIISDLDVGKDSNGDKFPCNATKIDISVTYKTSSAIEISVPYFKVDYNTEDLRYVIYFTKALHKNVSLFDDFDECSDLGWKTKDFSVDPNDSHFMSRGVQVNLTDLEPYTQYAFYVTTYTEDRYGAKSAIYYETTLPSKPSELTQLLAFSKKSSEITLQWDPPKKVNGKLVEYLVTWYILRQNVSLLRLRNYCEHPGTFESQPEVLSSLTLPFSEEVGKKQKSCCTDENKNTYTPKTGFEQMCSHFKECPFRSRFVDKDLQKSCESCFYWFVFESPFPQSALQINSSNMSIRNTRTGRKTQKYTSRNDISQTYVTHVSGNLSGFTIVNLHHFQDYLVTVRACREIHPMEQDQSINSRCSSPDITTTRTLREESSDGVNNMFINEMFNDTVIISWNAPTDPNGAVIAFEIEHRHIHADNLNPIVNCITVDEYESNRNTFSIVGLALGSYEVRVRAITLAGKGPFSKYVYFSITKGDFSVLTVLYFTIVLCIIISLFSVGLTMYHKKKHKLDILIASVNPDYQYVQDHWEISGDNVELLRELGAGSFGKVYEGIIKSKNQPCAVKTVSEDVTEYGVFVFLSEASVMKSVAEAYHIVRLLGVVSTVRPPLVVMELMVLGDLKSYLRSSRENNPPSITSFMKMASQIGDGMTFLEAKKYVHRDLAARNCLVSEDHVVKVGDFGMARDVYETDYYRKTNAGLLPIRWMAPESLKDGIFTSQSDVWSYGVVLWEMTTLAEQPYQGASNDQVLTEVIDGRKLEVPPQAPELLKTIMKSCWTKKASRRMTFMQIVAALEDYHDERFKRVAYFYTREAKSLRRTKSDYVEMQSVDDPRTEGSPVVVEQNRLQTISTLLSRVRTKAKGNRLSRIEEDQVSQTS